LSYSSMRFGGLPDTSVVIRSCVLVPHGSITDLVFI